MGQTKFDVVWRGYRMAQVDQALQRAAYDIGYKGELIGVLEAEVAALREGRLADADVLRKAREAAVAPTVPAQVPPEAEVPVIEISVVPADDPAPKAKPEEAPAAKPADKPSGKGDDEKVEESEAAERR